jgi:hypothetical protein
MMRLLAASASGAVLAACIVQPAPAPQGPAPAEPAYAGEEEEEGVPTGTEPEVAGPVDCHGNQTIVLENRQIEAAGVAVDLHGNCSARIMNSHIIGDVALDVHGNAQVVIENSTLEGRRSAMTLHGNGTASASNSEFRGGISRHGNGQLIDQGNNTWD